MIRKIFIFLVFITLSMLLLTVKRADNYTRLFGYSLPAALNMFLKTNQLAAGMDIKYYHKPTILILGVDERNDLLEHTQVTDTIMLAQLNLLKNTISLVSLPRDTWDEDFKFKINNFYPFALKNHPNDWQNFIKEEFSRITGQTIDNILLINSQSFDKIAEAIGPVIVNLPYSFTDIHYPNPAYVKNPSSNIPIYKTVSFSQGPNQITSQNVLEFVRSRKGSDDPHQGGTDLGRIGRQQLLLEAYLSKLKANPSFSLILSLYKIFHQELKTDLTDETILIYAQSFENIRSIVLNKISLPTNTKNSVMSDPGHLVENQSVLLPTNNNFEALSNFLKASFP